MGVLRDENGEVWYSYRDLQPPRGYQGQKVELTAGKFESSRIADVVASKVYDQIYKPLEHQRKLFWADRLDVTQRLFVYWFDLHKTVNIDQFSRFFSDISATYGCMIKREVQAGTWKYAIVPHDTPWGMREYILRFVNFTKTEADSILRALMKVDDENTYWAFRRGMNRAGGFLEVFIYWCAANDVRFVTDTVHLFCKSQGVMVEYLSPLSSTYSGELCFCPFRNYAKAMDWAKKNNLTSFSTISGSPRLNAMRMQGLLVE